LAHNEQYGIGVPNGEVAKTPEEAEAIAKKIGKICLQSRTRRHLLIAIRG
jgi:acyl-CoA synthetase (NDP forming)